MQEENLDRGKKERRLPNWLKNGLLNRPVKHHGMKEKTLMGGLMSVLNPIERKKNEKQNLSDEQNPLWFLCAKAIAERKGFIIIIGLSIVALTTYYSIMVQTQMINTVQEVRKNNELFQAKSVAQSVSNFVSYVVDKHEAGFSLEPVECKYVGGKLANGSQNPLCVADSYFDTIAQRQWAKGNNIST